MIKKIVLAHLIVLCFTTAGFSAKKSQEGSRITVGVTSWLSFWTPPWGNNAFVSPYPPDQNAPVAYPSKVNTFKILPGVMAGPMVSITFLKRFTLSTVFLTGSFKAHSEGMVRNDMLMALLGGLFIIDSTYTRDITRYDSDTSFSVTLSKYFKIFAGMKYQSYHYKEKKQYTPFTGSSLILYFARGQSNYQNFGPALGVSTTIPVVDNLFIIGNISGMILFGKADYKFDWQVSINTSPFSVKQGLGQHSDENFYAYAGNTSLSLAYYIPAAQVTLSVGGRYQILYYIHERSLNGFLYLNKQREHFYGAIFSASYSFNAFHHRPI